MPLSSAYYDTCVFADSLNPATPEYAACRSLLDAKAITWRISFCSDITFGEATITEYVETFETLCASHGIEILRVRSAETRVIARRHLGLKKRLRLMQFSGRDFTHLMAAIHSKSESLCTVDLDFWDPVNKAYRAAAGLSVAVKAEIEHSVPILIHKPSEFLAA